MSMSDERNTELIRVLKSALAREYEKKEKAELEIIKLKQELVDLGVELPLGD